MKFLLSLLSVPSWIALILEAICAIGCRLLVSGEMIHGISSTAHSTRAVVYFLIASGLTLSVANCAITLCLAFLGLLFKSWHRMIISVGIFIASVFLWKYFLSFPYFLDKL